MDRKIFIIISLFASWHLNAQQLSQPLTYYCQKFQSAPKIDGDINDHAWQHAQFTPNFIDIQGNKMPNPRFETRVKMLWDDTMLYIAAYMEEPHVWAKLKKDESIIFYDNDFEIFIDPDGDNLNYYELEFNAFNTKWDLFLTSPYRAFQPVIYGWQAIGMKSAVKIYGSINDTAGGPDSCWTFEAAIPLSILSETLKERKTPIKGDVWRVNFSRVQWKTEFKNGAYEKTSTVEDNWVWTSQHNINMHMPEYWGYLVFVDSSLNNHEPIIDDAFELKGDLMKIYYDQRAHWVKTGKYYGNEKTLDILKINKFGIKINVDGQQWTAAGIVNGKKWVVNQNSKLWQE